MSSEILEMLGNMFVSLFSILDKFFVYADAWGIVIGGFTIYTIARLLLKPLLGGKMYSGFEDAGNEIAIRNRQSRQSQDKGKALEENG